MMRQALAGAAMAVLVATSASAQIGGPGWAPGVAIATNLVGNAEQVVRVDTFGVVRLVEDRTHEVLPIIEGHVTVPIVPWLAVGPFMSVVPGEDIVNEIGFGILSELSSGGQTFVLGIGAYLDPNAQILQDDWIIGQFAPREYWRTGEVPYVERGEWRAMLLFGLGM